VSIGSEIKIALTPYMSLISDAGATLYCPFDDKMNEAACLTPLKPLDWSIYALAYIL